MTIKQTWRIVGAATEAGVGAVTAPQPADPVEAEVVDAAKAKTESLFAHAEIVEIARSDATAETGTIIAEETVETVARNGVGQVETAMIVGTVHALAIVTVIEDGATVHAVGAAAAAESDETVIDPGRPVLHTETQMPSRRGSKLKSRNGSKKLRNTSLRRKRLKKRAYRFQDGLIEEEMFLLPSAPQRCVDETLPAIGTGIEIVRDRLA
jgi:hypothetical protein